MFETQAPAQLESFRHIIQRSAKSGQQAGQNADDPPLMFGQSKLLGIRVIAASRAFNNSKRQRTVVETDGVRYR